MSGLTCCFWWLLLGALLGWLASWLFGRAQLAPAAEHVAPAAPPPSAVDFAKARAAGFAVTSEENLEIIEGIGPQIARLLRAAGITTFAKLAVAPVSTLQDILTQAGPRFKLADPGTWPEQSRLAADNRWGELAALQDKLDAGVRRDA
jgi:predicted flap endonuclease-1-like 5' DNA nuclease